MEEKLYRWSPRTECICRYRVPNNAFVQGLLQPDAGPHDWVVRRKSWVGESWTLFELFGGNATDNKITYEVTIPCYKTWGCVVIREIFSSFFLTTGLWRPDFWSLQWR